MISERNVRFLKEDKALELSRQFFHIDREFDLLEPFREVVISWSVILHQDGFTDLVTDFILLWPFRWQVGLLPAHCCPWPSAIISPPGRTHPPMQRSIRTSPPSILPTATSTNSLVHPRAQALPHPHTHPMQNSTCPLVHRPNQSCNRPPSTHRCTTSSNHMSPSPCAPHRPPIHLPHPPASPPSRLLITHCLAPSRQLHSKWGARQ